MNIISNTLKLVRFWSNKWYEIRSTSFQINSATVELRASSFFEVGLCQFPDPQKRFNLSIFIFFNLYLTPPPKYRLGE